jgi:hypothetical protein
MLIAKCASTAGRAMTAAPSAISAPPAIFASTMPCFQCFSTKNRTKILAIQNRFISPTTSNTAITEPTTVRAILDHLGEPIRPSIIAPARGPPLGDVPDAAGDGFDAQAPPAPAYPFDQRITGQVSALVEHFFDIDVTKSQR